MFTIPLPWPQTQLLLTWRWTNSPLAVQGAIILLALVPLLLVLWLYMYEMRLVKSGMAIVLLSLRVVLLTFLLFVALLAPILVHSTTEEFPGRVVIAVDRSDSMDVADPQRPIIDKLYLARALHLASDLVTDSELDDWIKQAQGKGEPVATKEAPNDPSERRKREEERRARLLQVCQRVDELTRSQIAERLLAESGGKLLPTVTGKHQVELDGFTTELWELKADQADELFRKRAVNGSGTDLGLPLARALERASGDQGKLLGVVLLTDGQHNWGASPVAKALELRGQDIKVFPVPLGARQAPPAIAIADVQSPPTVFKDVDVDIQARVQITGLPAQDLIVELQRPGQPPLTERIRHDGSDRAYVVPFRVRMEQAGTQTMTLTVKQLAGAGGPAKVRTENASRPLVVSVADDKAKVLLVDGEARYEYHYLSTALSRDRTMQVKRVVFQQPRLGKLPEEELEKLGNPALKLPVEPDALSGYDCIILGDVSPEQLPLPERIRLEKYVADRGGTLVILAGKRFMPLAYAKMFDPATELDPLLKLLPIVNERVYDSADGFKVTLTEEGQQVPFLQMETTPEKSRERWGLLPPHHWAVIGEAKPGAVPLASFAEDKGAQPVAGLNVEAVVPGKTDTSQDPARKRALIVRQNYGFGRVLYVGLDSSWRWRFKVGDTYHHRFWGQAIRWAAADKPLIAGNDNVRFGSREPVYRQGQEVDVVVRLGDDVTPPRPDSLAGARIVRADDKNPSEDAVALVPLKHPDAQPRVLEGKVRDLPPGRYLIELAIPELADKLVGPTGGDGQPTKLTAPFTVTPRNNAEMIDLGTNYPLLEEIAAKSNGKVYAPENVAELADALVAASVQRQSPIEHKFWMSSWMLLFFLLFVSVEWICRKWAGLP